MLSCLFYAKLFYSSTHPTGYSANFQILFTIISFYIQIFEKNGFYAFFLYLLSCFVYTNILTRRNTMDIKIILGVVIAFVVIIFLLSFRKKNTG